MAMVVRLVWPPNAQSVAWWISDWAAVRGTTGEGAAAVSGEQGLALAGCGEPLASAVGEDAAGVVEDGGQHVAVCGELERLVDAQIPAVVGGGPAGSAFQVGQRQGDDQLRRQAGMIG
jgi:hypothetical protein